MLLIAPQCQLANMKLTCSQDQARNVRDLARKAQVYICHRRILVILQASQHSEMQLYQNLNAKITLTKGLEFKRAHADTSPTKAFLTILYTQSNA